MADNPYELNPQTLMIPINQIVSGVNITNIRTVFNENSIKELAEGIFKDGLLNPLVVMEAEDKEGDPIIELVCGARRLRAIQYIIENFDPDWGDGEVRCTQYTGSVEDAAFLNGLENIEREEVDHVDTCAWLFRMVEGNGWTQEEMAQRMRKSPQWVSMRITIHRKGTDTLKQALRDGVISISAAYELAKQLSADDQDKRVNKARKNAEKITQTEAEVAGDPDRVPRPSKKKLGNILSKAEKAAADLKKRNAHGVAMAIRYVFGTISLEEIEQCIEWEGEPQVEEPAEEPKKEPPPVEEPKKKKAAAGKRRGKKGAEE